MSSHKDFARQAPGATGVDFQHPAAAHLRIIDAEAGRVDVLADRKKIAICGFASSSRHLIPVDDPTWLIGGMNQLYRHIPRADYWFDIHANWTEGNVDGTDHPRWIRECGLPVYMTERVADAPTTVRFPIERLIEKFGIDYYTSTVSYMLAWAIDEIDSAVARRIEGIGVLSSHEVLAVTRALYAEYTIGIFGIDLIVGEEYDFQKSCAEFWIGMANARGITVQIPPMSALVKQRWRYGYQQSPTGGVITIVDLHARQADLRNRIGKLNEMHSKVVAELQTLDGALQEVTHHITVHDLRVKGGQIPLAAGQE